MENQTPNTNSNKTSLGMAENIEALLCYVAGWVTGIVFLVLEKDNKFVKFHALQSIITFGALFVISIACNFIPYVGGILGFLVGPVWLILYILLIVKAYRGEYFKLPVVGDIAEQQLNK